MFDFAIVLAAFPRLLRGAVLTLELSGLVLLAGAVLALPVALAQNARRRIPAALARGYIAFFRGTPSLIQVFLLYYGAGQFAVIKSTALWPVLRNPFWCVVIALSLNSAAYSGKMLAGALKAVPRGMSDAAFALGLGRSARLWTIELPLALRIVLPAYGNEVIMTCKATSLASTVTLMELTGSARLIASDTYAPYEVFISAGLIYLAINFALMTVLRRLELRLRNQPNGVMP